MEIADKRDRSEHDGQVLIIVAVASIVFVLFLALSVDAGLALSERRGAQNAADAASMAVARAMIDDVTDEAKLRATALHYAELNGFDLDEGEIEVEFPEGTDGTLVDIVVRHEVPRVFLGAFYDGDWSVSAGAAASLETIPYDYGLIALDEAGSPIRATGNTHVRVIEGGMMSNGDIECAGSSTITAETAVHASGVHDTRGICVIEGDEETREGVSMIDDPLAGTPGPSAPSFPNDLPDGECEYQDESYNSVAVCSPGHYTSWSWASGYGIRFEPGTYLFDTDVSTNPWDTGEIEMQSGGDYTFYVRDSRWTVASGTQRFDMSDAGSVNMYFQNSTFRLAGPSQVTLGSGLYYFDNSDFRKEGGATASGTDVSFYFTDGGSMIGRGYNDDFQFTAPAEPLYDGMPPHMLVHSPPGNEDFVLDLGASSNDAFLGGVVYMPDNEFILSGNTGGTWARGQLIVGRFSVTGSSDGYVEYEQLVELGKPGVWLVR